MAIVYESGLHQTLGFTTEKLDNNSEMRVAKSIEQNSQDQISECNEVSIKTECLEHILMLSTL